MSGFSYADIKHGSNAAATFDQIKRKLYGVAKRMIEDIYSESELFLN